MYSTQTSNPTHPPMRRSLIIHLRALLPDITEENLKSIFSTCGRVTHVHLRGRHKTPDAWGSGYVNFASQESVDKALSLDAKDVLGPHSAIYPQFELPDTIHVGNLPSGASSPQVKALFSSCGEIVDIRIHPSLSGQALGRCYSHIRFALPISVDTALSKPFRLKGRSLIVTRAVQLADDRSMWDDYAADAARVARTIHISNLPPQINDERLAAEFEQCGEVQEARVSRTYRTGGSLGYGHVVFSSPASVDNALLFNTQEIAGHPIHISRAPPFRPAALEYNTPRPDAQPSVKPDPTSKIFVGRLTRDTDDTMLRRAFARFGDVVDARIVKDRATGLTRGFGYVEFASPESVELAVQYDGRLQIDGFSAKIARTYPKPNRRPSAPLDSYPDSWEYDY